MVEVSWTIEPNRPASILRFAWQERGGPPVNPPVREGFGTQLLKAVCSDVRLQYAVDGFRCDIAVPLGAIQHSPETLVSGWVPICCELGCSSLVYPARGPL